MRIWFILLENPAMRNPDLYWQMGNSILPEGRKRILKSTLNL